MKTKTEKKFKKEDIHALFGDYTEVTFRKDMARIKALLWIHSYQTIDEQVARITEEHNGVGFTGIDADLLSSFAEQVYTKFSLSDTQLIILRRKMKKYEKQMAGIANMVAATGNKAPNIDLAVENWAKNNRESYYMRGLMDKP